MAEDYGAILRHISSLKDMVDKVNEEIEQNIQKTREIESEIVQHSETEKQYLNKESELTKEISVIEFELNGLIHVAAAESDLLKVAEGNLEFQKVAQDRIRKRLSDKMEKFINESMGFQANMLRSLSEHFVLLLNEKSSLEDESAKLKMKIDTIHSSSKEYIAEILEEVSTENSDGFWNREMMSSSATRRKDCFSMNSTNQLQICNNQSKMNYYCLLRARCLEHQPVVALNLLFELLPLRLRVGRAAYWCRLCPNAGQIKPQAAARCRWGTRLFGRLGKVSRSRRGRALEAPSRTGRGHRSWLAGSLRVFDSWARLAGRPSWMVDGRRQQTWPFYSCLDQIYTEFGLFICIIHVYA
ncbi:uncharacterized protein [Miscanthus floridulus]|uniref:uncharacterized protein isoform X1 n=1 Tax=Miscanthus floridulus TaxID=154761 RepID=UPI00345B40D7